MDWKKRYKLGKVDGESIYIYPPEWDCGWYWGFGYIGNTHCHYHLDGLPKAGQGLFGAIKEHFGDSLTIKEDADLWTFCELARTAYTLREAAAVLGRGGSHQTSNPCSDIIKNKEETDRINSEVLPAIFNAMHEVLSNGK